MRSSLVLAALGISIIACGAEGSKTATSDWECSKTAVRNGETVTCTAAAKEAPAKEVAQAPTGGIFVRSYQVPSAPAAPAAPADEAAPAAGSSTPDDSTSEPASNPGAPAPHEYDCSVGGESCPPAEALPPSPAPPAGDTSAPAPGPTAPASTATDYRCSSADAKTTCTRKTIECKAGTMQVGEECLAPTEPPTTPPANGGGCTLTQGYWKNHASKWPTQMLTIGGVTYGQAELLSILRTPTTGDASLILGHQLIASMLNAANGASQAQVGSVIQAAQTWMSANKDADGRIPYGVASSAATGGDGVAISAKLDSYNNGGMDIPHCN